MKVKTIHKFSLAALLLLAMLIGRCSAPVTPAGSPSALVKSTAAAIIWTCSMHPNIQLAQFGACPICGMDLIAQIDDAQANDTAPRALSMSESSRALAEIQTTEVTTGYPSRQLRLAGQLNYAETHEKSLTARFSARIEKLYVNYTGVVVQQGEHLAEVYSPELLTAQRELLSAYQREPLGTITAAAREKLRLWGLMPQQIESILSKQQAQDSFELRSPINGVVVMKEVKEGDYVQTGDTLFKIVDMSELWLTLDAYESDLFWLRYGQDVEFTVEAYPGEKFTGQVVFIAPELNRKTRTIPIRINVSNLTGQLKPGMFARALLQSRIAQNGQVYAPDLAGKWISPMHPQIIKDVAGNCDICGMDLVSAESLGYMTNEVAEAPLLVPCSAVLRTGKRAIVYVAVPDSPRPTYQGREIVLGPKAGEVYLVKQGLSAGERVVTHGAFKIDSALQIQAKPSMMSRPQQQQQQQQHHAQVGDGPSEPVIDAKLLNQLLPHYFALQTALAADDLPAAQAGLDELLILTGHQGELADIIHHMQAAANLDSLRRPHFETLSNTMIAAVKNNRTNLINSVYQMNCSMVYSDRGADWLQNHDSLLNPYYGAMMLKCGTVKEIFAE
jgi:membrane fusion protein, copper/silver efflux system